MVSSVFSAIIRIPYAATNYVWEAQTGLWLAIGLLFIPGAAAATTVGASTYKRDLRVYFVAVRDGRDNFTNF